MALSSLSQLKSNPEHHFETPFRKFYLRSIIAPNKITAINGIVKIVICTPAFCSSSQSIIFSLVIIQNYFLLIYLGSDPLPTRKIKRKEISRDWLPGECLKTLRLT